MHNEYTLNSDLRKRKTLLHNVAKTNSSWKYRMFFTVLLFILSAAIMISICILLLFHPTTAMGVFIFICFGIMMACVPFFIAIGIKNKAKYICAFPYSSYANASLFLEQDDLRYEFWQVGPTEPAAYSSKRAVYNDEDKFTFIIDKKSIIDIEFDNNGVCNVLGKGKINAPKWAELTKSEIDEISKDFSFILAFDADNAKEIIINWRNYNL